MQTPADRQATDARSSHPYNLCYVLNKVCLYNCLLGYKLVPRELRGAAAGSGLGPARVRPSAPAHPRRRRPLKMNEAGEGRCERGKDGPASTGSARRRRRLLTAAAESRVAVRAAAVATDATGNECTAAPRLSGGQTSFGLEHPERHRTRK